VTQFISVVLVGLAVIFLPLALRWYFRTADEDDNEFDRTTYRGTRID